MSAAYFAKVAFTEPELFRGKLTAPLWCWRILGIVGVIYSLFLSWASGAVGLTLMSLLYLPGVFVYIWGKRERGEKYLDNTVDRVVVAIILLAAAFSLYLLISGTVVI